MNSTVFAVAVISATLGAVAGVLIHYIISQKSFNRLGNYYLEEAKKVTDMSKTIIRLQDEINRLHQTLAVQAVMKNKITFKKSDFPEGFFDVNDLPKHFNDDIDFGGKF